MWCGLGVAQGASVYGLSVLNACGLNMVRECGLSVMLVCARVWRVCSLSVWCGVRAFTVL